MSNCVDIHNHTVCFTANDMDIERLRKDLLLHGKCRELGNRHELSSTAASICEAAHYWLDPDSNVSFDTDLCYISFGAAESHTFRDLNWTRLFLGNYMLKEVKHIFTMSEEGDGFDALFPFPITFSPAESLEKEAS